MNGGEIMIGKVRGLERIREEAEDMNYEEVNNDVPKKERIPSLTVYNLCFHLETKYFIAKTKW